MVRIDTDKQLYEVLPSGSRRLRKSFPLVLKTLGDVYDIFKESGVPFTIYIFQTGEWNEKKAPTEKERKWTVFPTVRYPEESWDDCHRAYMLYVSDWNSVLDSERDEEWGEI